MDLTGGDATWQQSYIQMGACIQVACSVFPAVFELRKYRAKTSCSNVFNLIFPRVYQCTPSFAIITITYYFPNFFFHRRIIKLLPGYIRGPLKSKRLKPVTQERTSLDAVLGVTQTLL